MYLVVKRRPCATRLYQLKKNIHRLELPKVAFPEDFQLKSPSSVVKVSFRGPGTESKLSLLSSKISNFALSGTCRSIVRKEHATAKTTHTLQLTELWIHV